MNNEKKYETLADLYRNFQAFRLAMKSLYRSHSGFILHVHSRCDAEWNNEAVHFVKGVLYTAFCLEYIDEFHYDYFVGVLNRYKSYNYIERG